MPFVMGSKSISDLPNSSPLPATAVVNDSWDILDSCGSAQLKLVRFPAQPRCFPISTAADGSLIPFTALTQIDRLIAGGTPAATVNRSRSESRFDVLACDGVQFL